MGGRGEKRRIDPLLQRKKACHKNCGRIRRELGKEGGRDLALERLKKGAGWAEPTQTKNATAPTDPDMMITAAEASKAAVRGGLERNYII